MPDPKDEAYAAYGEQELALRDALALDRTLLANERTLLAWLRTAVALALAGVTLFHFASGWVAWIGLSLVPAGLGVGWLGYARYRRTRDRIGAVLERSTGRGATG
ncbi:MAG: DUF202 domain-containing protein [Planctomycetota bacterium]